MFERGLYGSTLVKRRRCWPTRIYGDRINAHCKKETGENDCLSGNWKGLGSDVLVLKQGNYNMIMMYTYSSIVVCEGQK